MWDGNSATSSPSHQLLQLRLQSFRDPCPLHLCRSDQFPVHHPQQSLPHLCPRHSSFRRQIQNRPQRPRQPVPRSGGNVAGRHIGHMQHHPQRSSRAPPEPRRHRHVQFRGLRPWRTIKLQNRRMAVDALHVPGTVHRPQTRPDQFRPQRRRKRHQPVNPASLTAPNDPVERGNCGWSRCTRPFPPVSR